MAQYTIEINDEVITSKVGDILNDVLNRELSRRYSQTQDVVADAVRDLVYSRKDEIIEMVVARATKEIVRKGLPRLLERGGDV